MLIQACQVASPEEPGARLVDPAPVDINDPHQDTHIRLLRPHTVLLLATVRGGKAIRGAFTQAMANQFKSADGKKDIVAMFNNAVKCLKKGKECQQIHQVPECRMTTDNPLILPPVGLSIMQ